MSAFCFDIGPKVKLFLKRKILRVRELSFDSGSSLHSSSNIAKKFRNISDLKSLQVQLSDKCDLTVLSVPFQQS